MCVLSVGCNYCILFFFRKIRNHLIPALLSDYNGVNRLFIYSFMEYLIEYGYIGVFIASFLAATILPFSSEVVLAGVLLASAAYWPCMIAATLGNFLGGMTCYWLGMVGKIDWIKKYLKMNTDKLLKMQDKIKDKAKAYKPSINKKERKWRVRIELSDSCDKS